jgi:hypothetical protein
MKRFDPAQSYLTAAELKNDLCTEDERRFYAHHGTCTRERTGGVLHESRFSRH